MATLQYENTPPHLQDERVYSWCHLLSLPIHDKGKTASMRYNGRTRSPYAKSWLCRDNGLLLEPVERIPPLLTPLRSHQRLSEVERVAY